jgi:2-oxoglutarate/2-oxoacid ferredoxin oxidoreductase subunit alpha
MAKELIKGNTAVAEAALRAGLEAYFGYPITPQTELLEHLSYRMPELGRPFVQAESELGAINMVYGAACTGKRVMTSSSSPGVSLMMEGCRTLPAPKCPLFLWTWCAAGPAWAILPPPRAITTRSCMAAAMGIIT